MAIYFKCDKCHSKFIDYYGENAHDDTNDCIMNGPYDCPNCGELLHEAISNEEFYKLSEEYKDISFKWK